MPKDLIGMMTGLLSSSLMAIFTVTSFFFKRSVLCSIPAYLHPQEYTFPAAVTCICWDLSLWCRSLKDQKGSHTEVRDWLTIQKSSHILDVI